MAQSRTGPGGEELLTKYLIFQVDEALVVLTRIGHVLARDSTSALRKWHETPLADNDGHYVAISENHAKLRHAEARVKTVLSEREWPDLPDPAAAQEKLA